MVESQGSLGFMLLAYACSCVANVPQSMANKRFNNDNLLHASTTGTAPFKGGNWTPYLLFEAAQRNYAVCLDGSPPLYFHSPGFDEGADKWEIHMEGGAWCQSAEECVDWWGWRSTIGDATVQPPDFQASTGYFNRSLATNVMKNWNYVFIRYCDGWSFAGNRQTPQVVSVINHTTGLSHNVSVHMRGRAVLDAVIDDLLTTRTMQHASQVVVGGCSAGGMAVYLNCDHWASKIAAQTMSKASVRCLSDSGWFPIIPDNDSFPSGWFNGVWRTGYTNHNVSVSMHPQCLLDYNTTTQWLCTMPEVAATYIEAPLFVYQSKYDAFQIPNMERCLGNHTDKFAPCTNQQMTDWGTMLTNKIQAWLATPLAKISGHAAFVDACYHHCPGKQYMEVRSGSLANVISS